MEGYKLKEPNDNIETWYREAHGCMIERRVHRGLPLSTLTVSRSLVTTKDNKFGHLLLCFTADSEEAADAVAADIDARWPAIVAAALEVKP